MAVKDFEGFAQLLTNENLQKNTKLRDGLKEAVMNADPDAVVQIGKEHGYDFSIEDVRAFHEQHSEGEELSDEDLENVAGGVGSVETSVAGVQALLVVAYGVATVAPVPITSSGGGEW